MVNRKDEARDPQPRRAVIYTRVARADPDSAKVMAAEIAAIQKYAEQNDIAVADSYSDEGESGNDPDRPGLAGLLAEASKPDPGFDTVLIRKWDRLARNLVLCAAIVKGVGSLWHPCRRDYRQRFGQIRTGGSVGLGQQIRPGFRHCAGLFTASAGPGLGTVKRQSIKALAAVRTVGRHVSDVAPVSFGSCWPSTEYR